MSSTARTAIVTGSSSGIGLDVARAFPDRGANVVLNGRDPEKLARAAASFGAPERVGRVDVQVNNAGTFAPRPFVDVTKEELETGRTP